MFNLKTALLHVSSPFISLIKKVLGENKQRASIENRMGLGYLAVFSTLQMDIKITMGGKSWIYQLYKPGGKE